MKEIKAVVLDLGGIVFDLDWPSLAQSIGHCRGLNGKPIQEFIGSWHTYDQYERGNLETQEYFTLFKQSLQTDLELQGLIDGWNKLIQRPLPGIDQALAKISKNTSVSVYALSNTNEAHYQYFSKTFPFMSHFQEIFTSFGLGLRKPEEAIYTAVIDKLGVEPSKTLFVDDVRLNVEAARRVGMNAEVCFNSTEKLCEIFRKYGVME